jgi:hypothetical protein
VLLIPNSGLPDRAILGRSPVAMSKARAVQALNGNIAAAGPGGVHSNMRDQLAAGKL